MRAKSMLIEPRQSRQTLSLARKGLGLALAAVVGLTTPTLLQAQSVGTTGPRAQSQLPTLGDGSDMDSNAERRLGNRIAAEIYRDPDFVDDPVLLEYVQGIWEPLRQAAVLRGDMSAELSGRFAWEVLLIRDHTVNAFALPGGYMGVHLGLISIVASRDELASVLGHELSHITQRHISRLMTRQSQQAPWLLGAMILGALAASKSPDAANALIVGGQAVSAQSQLNFSRDMEREADRIGFGLMTQAGFAPQGFVSMFDKLQQASRLNDNGAFPYLRTHPLTTERIADMQSRQALLAPDLAPGTVAAAEHAMIAARASVLSNPGVDALRALTAQASANSPLRTARQAGALYGAALAASRLRNFEQAGLYQARLRELVQNEPAPARLARLLDAEVALSRGDLAQATAALQDSPSGQANPAEGSPVVHRPELLLQAQIAARSGRSEAASQSAHHLQSWVLAHPHDALAWQQLSSVYGAQSQALASIRADAEARAARLDYAGAMDRFRAAQDLVRASTVNGTAIDHIEASIVDTRRREVESLVREQALER